MSVIISNASPLIGLSAIDQLDILKELWTEIIIPEAVYKETVIDGRGKQGADKINAACGDWIKVAAVENRSEVEALKTILDNGEAEVIALGQELKAGLLLLDNREPRIFAKSVGMRVIGTVGVIRLAWQKGIIKKPIDELYKLRLNGFWIDDELIKRFADDIQG
jgi:predicted nucleic acid-binding protein